MSVILNVSNLKKSYNGGKTFTIKNVSFEVAENEIVGLVGNNGVGKSTIIKSVTGVLPFDGGDISILGNDVVLNSIDAKKHLGYVPDVCNAFDKMTGIEYLNFVADIFHVSKKDREERLSKFQQSFPLGQNINKLISSYSHGMKQKISLMASLISNPKMWILDEPTTGLDPQTTNNLLSFIQEYASQGNAVLFSSHNLDIVKKVCNRAIKIHGGKLVASITIKENTTLEELENFFMRHGD